MSSAMLASMALVSGCQTTGNGPISDAGSFPGPLSAENSSGDNQQSVIKTLVAKSTDALRKGNLQEASKEINLALKLDVTNPDLQLLNGLTYHLMGVAGDTSKYDLAEQGYEQALRFDPGNIAAHYQLGLLYLDQRRYSLAQSHFATVALSRGDDTRVLYSLAVASYYARDPMTAEAALKRLHEVDPKAAERPDILKARALTLAAMNDRSRAEKYVEEYKNAVQDASEARSLERRVDSWKGFYDSDAKVILAQFNGTQNNGGYGTASDPYGTGGSGASDPYGTGTAPAYGTTTDPYASSGQGGYGETGTPNDPNMVVVDVVLIGTQEDARDSYGINLLNGLHLQFGDPLTGTAGWGLSETRTKDYLDTGLKQSTQTITRMISIPAVNYSLNIANSLDANNQILAKPSLVAQAGQTSEFFSGTEVLAAAVSGGNGDSVSVQKEVGVKLAVTPEILPDDMIRLHVVAERTFLTDPSNSVVFEFRLDTTKTNVNSTVTMKFGETLVLGGLSERETTNASDGVPILKDIPGLNLFFSQKSKRQFNRSILILLTPRRPFYTRRADEDRQKTLDKMSDLERDLERLQQRHKDWFTPEPTFSGIIKGLQGREFFEEFRIGDLQVHSWEKSLDKFDHIAAVRKRLMTQ